MSAKIPAASRTLALLRNLAKAAAPVTAVSLARQIGAPRSTTYQLLQVLESEGFVIHYPETARWGIGVAAFELGTAYLRHDPLERLARPILHRLVIQLDQLKINSTAQVGILDGSELLYLLKENPTQAAVVVTDVGVRLPAHLTASGRSMLALLPKNQFKALYPSTKPISRRTEQGPETSKQLQFLLEQELTQGFSVESGHVSEGLNTIAAAATNHLGLPTAAFAVTFRTEDANEATTSQLAKLVISASNELSKRLGATQK
jgi:DNA-binding IclR family transcriptional regulator